MAVKPGEKYCGAHRDEADGGLAEDREWGFLDFASIALKSQLQS